MVISRIISNIILIILIQVTGSSHFALTAQEPAGKTVKIGMLINDEKSLAAKQAAALAIRKANEKGGMNGRKFELVVRSMEGPWGTGSKQAVDLIFEENVWALLGSHDGRNAHLVEQAATKAGVVFISCWSGDATLSQAFIPWFFNCVPNNNQQAEILVNEIYYTRKFSNIISVTDKTYDSNQAYLSFKKKTEISGRVIPGPLIYDDYMNNPESLAELILNNNHDCILLFCSPPASSRLMNILTRSRYAKPVFGFTLVANDNELSEREMNQYDNVLKMPAGKWNDSLTKEFVMEYRSIYGKFPGMAAAFAYDGMNALIEAVTIAGIQDREKIQHALEEINLDGITGQVRFDGKGNRSGALSLRYLKNGLPVL